MRPGLSNDLQQINDSRKTAIIDSELDRLNIDIATLQETRLAENGSLKEQRHTFFWQGKSIEEKRGHGVGFAVKNSLLKVTEPPVNGSARILTIRLSTRAGCANILSVCATTLCSTADCKDQFYEELDVAFGNIPKTEQLYILGDFNARVGADHEAWPTCLGHHGMMKMNENGQRLLELCCHFGLSNTNTFFGNKLCHKMCWTHPRSGHWHHLDFVITRRDALNSILNTCSYHSADCDIDHSLICASIIMQPTRLFHSNRKSIYVSTSVTLHIQRRINSSLNQSERRSLELKPRVQKRTGTPFLTSYTTLHSQHTTTNNERTQTGTRQTSL